MEWIEITVEAHPEAVESVSELLADLTGNGIALEEPFTLADDGQESRSIAGAPVTLRAYLAGDEHAQAKLARLRETLWHLKSLGDHFIGQITTQAIHEEDWANAWKAHTHVMRIGRRTVIQPTWREFTPDAPDQIVIVLDPGMAFGTGAHPTTRSCLIALEDVVHAGDTVLDAGTGSGILAIAALKLGAAHALALDVSAVAVEAARENLALNGVADRAEARRGTIGVGPAGEPLILPAPPEPGDDPAALLRMVRALEPVDLVVANIIARVIGELAPALVAALRPGGRLIASGIIAERRHEAEVPLRAAGCEIVQTLQEGDWITLIGRRGA